MDEAYILTLDAGTTGVKCAAFSPKGEAACSAVEAYPTYYPFSGWAQQKPGEQLDAALRAIRIVLEKVPAEQVCALVFSGTMNGCIPIDEKGEALHENIIHSDLRAEPQTEQLRKAIPLRDYYAVTGNRIDVHSGLPKYIWLRQHRPEVYGRAWKFVNIKDYLYGRFTGLPGRTDRSDASLCNCLNMHTGDWAWDILREAGVDAGKMPELHASTDVTGTLSAEFAALTGLPQGLPVAIGAGDGACAAHGARQHVVGDAYMNIGSSAWVSSMSKKPVIDREMRLFNYFDLDETCYNVCGTVQCGSAASNWAIENLIYPGTRAADCDFAKLEALARTAPAGAQGVMYLPTLMGERTPWWTARVSGTLMGFTLYHGPQHIARAVYEGVMQSLHMCGDILGENGLPVRCMTLIGGGAKSRLWGQMAADMFDAQVRVHATPHEATSLGAAFAAGVGIGWYQDFAQAARQIHFSREYTPDPAAAAAYQKHLAVYKALYPNMKGAYEALADYQASLNEQNQPAQ